MRRGGHLSPRLLFAAVVIAILAVGAIEGKGDGFVSRTVQGNTGEIAGATIENLPPASAAQLGFPPDVHLVIVTRVESSAEKAGLLPGDIIVAVDNEAVTNVDEVSEVAWRVGMNPVALSVIRGGEVHPFSVLLLR